jgi:hypothetical protein
VDELPLNDDRVVEPVKGSKAWRKREWVRYRAALWKYNGLYPVYLTAFQLGISRQRVHQLFDKGVLERVEFFGHLFARGDEIDRLVAMTEERRDPAFRWAKVS